MIKLIDSEYDKENGVSYVTIQTELGNFSGVAFLHPEDEDFPSSFLGCEIAEYRATIDYFEKLLYRLNIEIKTLESLRIDFIRTYKEEYHECMLLEKRLKQKNKLKQEIKENIKSLKELIDNKINNRLIIAKRMQEKKEEKSKLFALFSKEEKMIYIYADGASKGNPGPGGFGVAVMENINITYMFSKQYENITNNQGELKALLLALGLATSIFKNEKVTILSDSAYCVNMFNDWIHSWARNGWKNSKNKTVENYELVLQLYEFAKIEFPKFSVEKVMGHCGILGNEIADALASNNQAKLEKIFLENKDNFIGCKKFDF